MTTVIYLSDDDLIRLKEGKMIKILVTENIQKSRQIVIRKDMSKEKEKDHDNQ